MSQENELCKDCGKKILTREIASITQWMFNTDICNCSSIRKASTENPPLDSTGNICTRCGKRKRDTGSGSMTQWIFGAALCSCNALRLKPNTEEEPGFPQILDSEEPQDEMSYLETEESNSGFSKRASAILLALISGMVLLAFLYLGQEKTRTKASKIAIPKVLSNKNEKTTLEMAVIPNSRIDDNYLASFASGSSEQATHLELNMSNITDSGLKHIENLPVRILDISYTEVTDKGLDSISRIKSLQKLDMKGCKITEKGLDKLSALPNLEILNVSGLNMSEPAMKSISRIKNLDAVMMTGVQNLTPDGLKQFSKLPALSRLYMRGTSLTDAHTAVLPQLKDLKTLSLKDNNLADSAIKVLTQLKKLEIIHLSGNKITDQGLAKLAQIKSLKQLEIADMPLLTDKGIHRFEKLKPNCLLILTRGNSIY